MSYTTQSTNTNSFMQEDAFFDANLDIDIMDDTGLFDGPDQLFSFDVFEESSEMYVLPLDTERRLSLTFARRLSITSVIHEDNQECQIENLFPDHCESNEHNPFHTSTFSPDQEDCTIIRKPRRQGRKPKVSRPAILSLLTSVQLEQQLEETKTRLAESMERSAMSRKRLNDEVDCSPEEYSPREDSFKKAQRSNSAPASVLSQSRARFASYMNSGMNITSRTL
mmetsp:Transcript_15206/g.22764  ORF Transcript_15206/g.22764 Transcript_15206/m.22764 type:complete len:224 (+) Transcript_15206:48-719(+)